MKQFWMDAGSTTLYQNWWVGPWAAILSAGGVYDPSPMRSFITKELNILGVSAGNPMQRSLSIGLVDVL